MRSLYHSTRKLHRRRQWVGRGRRSRGLLNQEEEVRHRVGRAAVDKWAPRRVAGVGTLVHVTGRLPPEVLNAAAQATVKDIKAWKRGVYLQDQSGVTIDELHLQVVVDRLELSTKVRRRGIRLMSNSPPHYRDAVSRFYYAMYHSVRAVVAHGKGGDDSLSHSALPDHIPGDFPDKDAWINALKDAREHRNAADYNIYPKSEGAWKTIAEELRRKANGLERACREYLGGKGVGTS